MLWCAGVCSLVLFCRLLVRCSVGLVGGIRFLLLFFGASRVGAGGGGGGGGVRWGLWCLWCAVVGGVWVVLLAFGGFQVCARPVAAWFLVAA